MLQTLMYAPGDVRVEEAPVPHAIKPSDAVIRVVRACVCGSDLWPFRGIEKPYENGPVTMGHEYIGEIVELGTSVAGLAKGDFVVGSFATSDGTCPICKVGYPSDCVHRDFVGAAQAQYLRVSNAEGTLVKVGDGSTPDEDLFPSLLAASDVFGTGYYGAWAADVTPHTDSVVVVGDGAVGLEAVLSAKMLGAKHVIAMSRHEDRAAIAREFGADQIVAERGEEGIARVKELTDGLGAQSVVEAVGTQQSMMQAIGSTRRGGSVGFVGVSHDQSIDGEMLFFSAIHLHGGPAPVRRWLPEFVDKIMHREINPGRVFTEELPLQKASQAYRDMDERREIKVMLNPWA